jgi:predicted component of viral defense system (DUF524 family)
LIADDETGRRGRLRPGLHTGALPIRILGEGKAVGRVRLEVRSRKLEYLSEYRWMLRDIAALLAEIVVERFAASEQFFEPEPSTDPVTAYQQFAFLRALLTGPEFVAAIARVLSVPNRRWLQIEETRPLAIGLKPDPWLVKAISATGERQPYLNPDIKGLSSLPTRVNAMSFAETLDTPENRFVKFAFRRWREAVERIHATLSQAKKSYPIERGIRETEEVLVVLDSVLGEPFFRELGDMTLFPASSVILTQRSGYRDIYRAYLQFEVAATLAWQGGDDIYGAGQRDVATLYEFWCFLELVKIVGRLCDATPLTTDRLLERTEDGLSVRLKREAPRTGGRDAAPRPTT